MSIESAVDQFFSENRIEPSHLVLALSGGPDSAALAFLLAPLRQRGFTLSAGHVNHHLRGEESDGDAAAVAGMAADLDIPLRVVDGRLDPLTTQARGIEAAARNVRYQLLETMRREAGADWVVTAHQMNDQAETLLIRLVSGSSPRRLAGIEPLSRDRKLLRPLLEVTRREIDDLLSARGFEARTDSSNNDRRFLRNRVRHELLPLLSGWNPSIVETLAETARQLRETSAIATAVSEQIGEDLVERDISSSRLELPTGEWLTRELLVREIGRLEPGSRDVSASDLRRIVRGTEPRVSITRDLEILRNNRTWTVRRRPTPTAQFERAITPDHPERIEEISASVTLQAAEAGDPEAIDLPSTEGLRCRNRRDGDRFRPLGSRTEKKLKDLLIDRRIPHEKRDALPLVTWMGRLVWVAGLGVSEEFRPRQPDARCWRVDIKDE